MADAAQHKTNANKPLMEMRKNRLVTVLEAELNSVRVSKSAGYQWAIGWGGTYWLSIGIVVWVLTSPRNQATMYPNMMALADS